MNLKEIAEKLREGARVGYKEAGFGGSFTVDEYKSMIADLADVVVAHTNTICNLIDENKAIKEKMRTWEQRNNL